MSHREHGSQGTRPRMLQEGALLMWLSPSSPKLWFSNFKDCRGALRALNSWKEEVSEFLSGHVVWLWMWGPWRQMEHRRVNNLQRTDIADTHQNSDVYRTISNESEIKSQGFSLFTYWLIVSLVSKCSCLYVRLLLYHWATSSTSASPRSNHQSLSQSRPVLLVLFIYLLILCLYLLLLYDYFDLHVYLSVCSLCVCAWSLWRSEECVRSSRTGATEGCEPLCGS